MRAALLVVLLMAGAAMAEPYASIMARKPGLFHPETGLRIDRHRAPTPQDIPGPARVASVLKARQLLADGAVPLDVFGAAQSRFDELDGTWLVSRPRMSLPGALWLPEVGRGMLAPAMRRYLEVELERATGADQGRPILVFCVADCWMSWNAAQRIAGLGYAHVYWFRLGTDGWLDHGGRLDRVDPVPVSVE